MLKLVIATKTNVFTSLVNMLKAINNFQNLSVLIQMLFYDTLPSMTLYKDLEKRHLMADHKMPGRIIGIRAL